jgi:hypothetical protein
MAEDWEKLPWDIKFWIWPMVPKTGCKELVTEL